MNDLRELKDDKEAVSPSVYPDSRCQALDGLSPDSIVSSRATSRISTNDMTRTRLSATS